MKKYFVLFLVAQSVTASAMDVWVTTPQPVSPEKMQAIIKNLPPEMKEAEVKSLQEEELRNPVAMAAKEKMEKILLQAQEEELHRNYGLAIKYNEQALVELEKYPNVLGLQSITQSVFLKLAELYDVIADKDKAQIFWQRAYAWNSQAELHPEVYSKAVIKKFKNLKPHSEATQIKIKTPLYSSVFFDGKKVANGQAKALTGKHQIAVLIPGSLWQIENLRIRSASKKPLVFDFKPQPVLSGSCETPVLSGLKLPAQTRLLAVYEKENCNRVFDGDTWYSIEGQQVYKQPAPSGKMLATMNTSPHQSWITKVTKSPWFWVGLGVAVVGTAAYVQSRQQPNVVPSSTHTMQ